MGLVVLVPEVLRNKLGDEAARELVNLINESTETVKRQILDVSAERFERRLTEVKTDIEKQISQTKMDLEKRISETKAEIIKWMFVFWVGQIAVIFGFLNYMLK